MSDSTFNYLFITIFCLALSFNCYVVYKIAQCRTIPQRRVIIINRDKKPTSPCFCSLDDDDWKEIKAETA